MPCLVRFFRVLYSAKIIEIGSDLTELQSYVAYTATFYEPRQKCRF